MLTICKRASSGGIARGVLTHAPVLTHMAVGGPVPRYRAAGPRAATISCHLYSTQQCRIPTKKNTCAICATPRPGKQRPSTLSHSLGRDEVTPRGRGPSTNSGQSPELKRSARLATITVST
eukprot:735655-Pleurochrysis_carterae.AAC.3